jgi:hypothetical protein
VRAQLHVSERRACAALGQHRSTQRKIPRGRDDEQRLIADIIELARQYGRYGYRKVAGLLRQAGWIINDKRVERIWRREGLKVPNKQPKRGRLWLADGSCIRLRPQHRNHVWSYDFVEDRTHDGRKPHAPRAAHSITSSACEQRKRKGDSVNSLFIFLRLSLTWSRSRLNHIGSSRSGKAFGESKGGRGDPTFDAPTS